MRKIAFALVFALAASPAFAKGKSKDGQYCKKKQDGKTATDKAGATLTCKADAKGKFRWTK